MESSGGEERADRGRSTRWKLGVGLIALGLLSGGLWLGLKRTEGLGPQGVGTNDGGPVAVGSAPAQPSYRRSQRVPAPKKLTPAPVVHDGGPVFGVVEGLVLSRPTVRGISGAELTFAAGLASYVATSQQDGRFRFSGPAGVYELAAATAAGFHPFAAQRRHSPLRFTVRPAERLGPVRVYLGPAVSYLGLVLDAGGKRVSGAKIRIVGATPGRLGALPRQARFVADGRGEFRFVAPVGSLLEVRHPERGVGRSRVDDSVFASRRLVIRLRSGPVGFGDATLRIAGRVVDPGNRAVDGALVIARYLPEDPNRQGAGLYPEAQARSGRAGRFTIEGLSRGRHWLVARQPGYARAATVARAGAKNVVLRLEPGGRLRGVVREQDTRAPVTAFSVLLSRRSKMRGWVSTTRFFDRTGRYEIEGLTPGTYWVTATARGWAGSEEVEVGIDAAPADPTVADLELLPGGSVHGVVQDKTSHRPITGARVTLYGGGASLQASSLFPDWPTTASDALGQFKLSGVPAGVAWLHVVAAGYHMRRSLAFQLRPRATEGPVVVALSPLREEEAALESNGIGAVVLRTTEGLQIGQPLPGSPAQSAGLSGGDVILRIDDVPVANLAFEEAMARLSGSQNKPIRLTVRRKGSSESEELVLTPGTVRF